MTYRVEILNGTVAIRPDRKNARAHRMVAATFAGITLIRNSLKADTMFEEWDWERQPDANVLKHFRALVHTGKGFVFADELSAYLIRESERAKARRSKKKIPDSLPEPKALTGHTFKAAYICGSDIYVSKR